MRNSAQLPKEQHTVNNNKAKVSKSRSTACGLILAQRRCLSGPQNLASLKTKQFQNKVANLEFYTTHEACD